MRTIVAFLFVIFPPKLSVRALIDFQCEQEQCLNELVQYQCIASDSDMLLWRIRDETMTQLGTQLFGTGSSLQSFTPIANAEDFSTDLSSTSPLISNISFTVQSSINRYTIICEDAASGGDMKNCTIDIAGPPSPPNNIIMRANQTTLTINWTPPTSFSKCVNDYTLNSNITAITNTTTTADTTSVSIPLAGLSATTYFVSIAAVDTANRTGSYSDANIFELKVPSAPNVSQHSCDSLPDNSNYAQCNLSLTFTETDITPPLTAVYTSNGTNNNSSIQVVSVPANQSSFSIEIQKGIEYTVSVFGENVLGNGSTASLSVSVSVSPTPSTSSTPSTTDKQTNVAAIVVPIVIVVLLLVVVGVPLAIVTIVFIISYIRRRKLHNNDSNNTRGDTAPPTVLFNRRTLQTDIVDTYVDTRSILCSCCVKEVAHSAQQVVYDYIDHDVCRTAGHRSLPTHTNTTTCSTNTGATGTTGEMKLKRNCSQYSYATTSADSFTLRPPTSTVSNVYNVLYYKD